MNTAINEWGITEWMNEWVDENMKIVTSLSVIMNWSKVRWSEVKWSNYTGWKETTSYLYDFLGPI